MSYTGIYGAMQAVEHDESPRITDRERFDELAEHGDFGTIFEEQAQMGEYQEDGYPRRTWDVLYGFRTWEKDTFYDLNIERVAYNYDRDGFFAFWRLVGQVCEPFYFVHSGYENRWPATDAHDYYGENVDDGFTEAMVVRVTVGPEQDITVEAGAMEFTGFEVEVEHV